MVDKSSTQRIVVSFLHSVPAPRCVNNSRIKFPGDVTLTEEEGGSISRSSLISTTFNFVPCLNHGCANSHS